MKIKSINFRNFKYIPENQPLTINFEDSKALVMGGPNGFGKTTVFDAIELLITGQLNHFQTKLLNRGEISYSVLAHDKDKDIKIIAEFQSSKKYLFIERIFNHNQNFDSKIYLNEQEVNNDELYQELGINKSFFEIGMYISQINSLQFLQKKYKDRKSTLSSILDNSIYTQKIEYFKTVQKALKEKFNQYCEIYKKEATRLDEERDRLNSLLVELKDSHTVSYSKLFIHEDYPFDKQVFEKEQKYDLLIKPINDLLLYTKNYNSFIEKKNNINIERIIKVDKRQYCALYFLDDIAECRTNIRVATIAKELNTLLSNYEKEQFYFIESIFKELHLDNDIIQKVKELILSKNDLEKGMNETQVTLSNFLKERTRLLTEYRNLVDRRLVARNVCPLCGVESDNLSKLFIETEQTLKNNLGLIVKDLSLLTQNLKEIYSKNILTAAKHFLSIHKAIITKYSLLSGYFDISTEALSVKLLKENIVFRNTSSIVDLKDFDEKYTLLIEELQSKIKHEFLPIGNEDYEMMQVIQNEYYRERGPYSEEAISEKKQYVITMFSNDWRKGLVDINKNIDELVAAHQKKDDRFKLVDKNVALIIEKYSAALKEYEKNIADSIAIPLFIFTGKLIQNFPLGLGITLKTEANAITFKSQSLEDDIFNNLSTGQLNGLMLSFLLSVNSVFSKENCLNMLMIDDPLQTIDDISAISLVDLLSGHFQDRQVILSTHEDDKQCLIKRKYEQSGLSCRTLNMQKQYLELDRR